MSVFCQSRLSLLAAAAGLLLLAAPARAEPTDSLSLGIKDITKLVVFSENPGRRFIELTYSKPKQAELKTLTSEGLPKSVGVTLDGILLGEKTFVSANTGHSLKFEFSTIDEALSRLAVLEQSLGAPKALSVGERTGTEASIVDLRNGDAGRVVLYLFMPDRCFLDVIVEPAKRDELAFLARQQPPRPLLISIGGRIVAELPAGAKIPAAGPLRLDVGSLSDGVAGLRTLAAER